MFTFQKNSAQYVYHYTSARTALDWILPSRNLRLSSFANTNDPKESREWFFIPGTNQKRDLSKYSPEVLGSIMNPVLKNSTRLVCFSKDKSLTGSHMEDMPLRGFCKARMWAQYGGNHSGVCLIFDAERLFDDFHQSFKALNYIRESVSYRDRLIADVQLDPAYLVNIDALEDMGGEAYAASHGQKFSNRLFFEKASDWSGEDEYRLLVFGCAGDLYLGCEHSLVGVLFGQSCRETDILEAVRITKGKLQYQQLNWRNCTPWFNFSRNKWQ